MSQGLIIGYGQNISPPEPYTMKNLLSIATLATTTALVVNSGIALAQACSSFPNCAEAVKSYKAGNSKLDRDKDGIPCEKLCGKNGENMPQ